MILSVVCLECCSKFYDTVYFIILWSLRFWFRSWSRSRSITGHIDGLKGIKIGKVHSVLLWGELQQKKYFKSLSFCGTESHFTVFRKVE